MVALLDGEAPKRPMRMERAAHRGIAVCEGVYWMVEEEFVSNHSEFEIKIRDFRRSRQTRWSGLNNKRTDDEIVTRTLDVIEGIVVPFIRQLP